MPFVSFMMTSLHMDAFQSFIDWVQCAVQPAVHPIQRIVQLPRPGPGRDPLPQPPCAAQCVRRVGIDAGADAGQQRGAEGGTLLHRRNLDLRAPPSFAGNSRRNQSTDAPEAGMPPET